MKTIILSFFILISLTAMAFSEGNGEMGLYLEKPTSMITAQYGDGLIDIGVGIFTGRTYYFDNDWLEFHRAFDVNAFIAQDFSEMSCFGFGFSFSIGFYQRLFDNKFVISENLYGVLQSVNWQKKNNELYIHDILFAPLLSVGIGYEINSLITLILEPKYRFWGVGDRDKNDQNVSSFSLNSNFSIALKGLIPMSLKEVISGI